MKDQEIDYKKAMDMLNNTLKEMKGELKEVDLLSLKGAKKEMAYHMHQIYDEIDHLIKQYAASHSRDDFNHACNQIKVLKPSFVLNYSEILH